VVEVEWGRGPLKVSFFVFGFDIKLCGGGGVKNGGICNTGDNTWSCLSIACEVYNLPVI